MNTGANTGAHVLDINLLIRNKADISADCAVFRMVFPQYLRKSESRHWNRDISESLIQIYQDADIKEDYQATILSRPYGIPDDLPIFIGAGPILLGTFKFTIPHESVMRQLPIPVLGLVSAPRMETRAISLEIIPRGADEMVAAHVPEDHGKTIKLNGKEPVAYFTEL